MSGRRWSFVLSLVAVALAGAACNKSKLTAGVEATPTPGPEPTSVEPPEYIGREFFALDLDNAFQPGDIFSPEIDAAGAQFAVVVSNPNLVAANVVVSNIAGEVSSKNVVPGGLEVFELPRADVDGTIFGSLAYRIVSDVPVTAHQFNPLGNELVYSNDASLLIPITALGTDYRVLSWPQGHQTALPGFVSIAAVQPGATEVQITVSANTRAGGDIPALTAGATYTRTLQQYDVLSLQTSGLNADLSGSRVTANGKIAVFSGAECANVPQGVSACDHLEEQMFPVAAWGKTYVAAKSKQRGTEPDVWRVLASVDNTTVTTDPYQPGTPVTLMAGQVVEFQTTASFVIQAGAPVMVGQFLVGQDFGISQAGQTGDPSFILAAPVEQFRSSYIFLTPPNYANDSISIVAPTGATVSLDGTALPASDFAETAPGSGWSTARIVVADGVHKLEADQPVGLTVTGYDQYVSYGYPGGLDLATLAE
jgi:hypothetical protein